ncbi:hypothetical protein FSP39_003208 [Pinctada imbricata]|uniref:VWFA domain-containing protein n=1 Tax=Pinctada imbricata TaxID=66713 RepID=A0AA88XJ36_PINIB|nr:hypothetical protein FSP39_003208 [Pinctada imbricata]
MFYSNTNWVELFGNTSCKELGIDGKNIIPTAPPSEAACSSCNYTLPKDEDSACVDNMLLDINYLTSGYLSYQGVNKPLDPRWTDGWGKCSHGGADDLTKDTIAIGGINKETSDPTLSPHYYLHQAAGQAAVQATIDFFVGNGTGLLDQIGPDAFNKLLQMHYEEPCYQCFTPDKSLVFVIDNTGSMGDDIYEVRKKAIEIVTFSQSSATKPFNYILATFNDPDTTLTVTTDGNELIRHLNALTAEGGDDCPEMAMAGLIRGIQQAKPGSCVFFFTDADAKDTDKEAQVEALIQRKRIKLTLFLRGTCGGVLPNKTKETQQQSQDGCLIRNTRVMSHSGRKRRSGLSGLGLYESLAGGTGSVIAHVSKDTLGSVLDSIVKHNLGIATINIEKFITSNATTSVPVDSDLNLVTIKIKGIYDADHVSLVSPDGKGNSYESHQRINTNKASKSSSNTTRLAVVLGAVMGVVVLTGVAIFAFIKIHSISVTTKPISMDQMYTDISSVERPELNGKIKYMHGH